MPHTHAAQAAAGHHRHPLAALRSQAGYSHGQYARLVADTHARLGYGQMAARREKVARWEAGRAVPELTAQLAIAHIHAVPEDQVHTRRWPDWLHYANGDCHQLELSWNSSAVAEAVLDAVDGHESTGQDYLVVTGSAVSSLVDPWMDAMLERLDKEAACPAHGNVRPGPQGGPGGDPGYILEACTRLRTLSGFAKDFSAGWLVPAAELELRQLATYLRADDRAHHPGRVPLLILAAEGLTVCGFTTRLQGRHVHSQRHHLAALRCATDAGDAELAAAILTLHAGEYLDLKLHEEAAQLLAAVGTLLRHYARPVDPALVALQHAQLGRVHALRGDDLGRKRAMVEGRRALRASSTDELAILPVRTESWLSLVEGVTQLDMGRPDCAIKHFAPVLSEPTLELPPSVRALYLLRAGEAQLALGDTAAGEATLEQATALLGGVQLDATERIWKATRAPLTSPAAERRAERRAR